MAIAFQARIARAFFDSKKVLAMLDKKTRSVLSRYGAYVRRTAQTSMRSRKGVSPPGSPPFAHGRKLLKRMLFFSYDTKKQVVVIGPVLLSKTQRLAVPSTLEYGGNQIVRDNRKGGVDIRRYEKRPYMIPAQNKHIGKVAQWYREVGI